MRTGFTLIELLIVVAIIAILAAIALPNFLEAQTRAKVARVKADLRTVAIALDAYHVDANRYPQAVLVPPTLRLIPLTSPVSYLTAVPPEVFVPTVARVLPFTPPYGYGAMPIDQESRYALASNGPDLDSDHENIEFYPGADARPWENTASGYDWTRYDPTNGTISDGDLWRTSDRVQP
ncbi:prepilin-type N-terminal cleavage/methylation domain-containing protein [bacterium]|nr:prepilin-type N-terminal cleavage/methylation domain-containing protein [bacterium]